VLLVFSIVVYLVSNIKNFLGYDQSANLSSFMFISAFNFSYFLYTPLILLVIVSWAWVGPELTAWFGHIIFTSFQYKLFYLITFSFFLVWAVYIASFYFTSQEVYDYTIVTYCFFLWLFLLFTANNIFTVIFFIEVLSALVTLTLITSVFSSTYFYNNLNFTSTLYFNNGTPNAFLQTLLFFFWISLVSSLNLFVFLTLFYMHFLTFDWFLVESIFYYLIVSGEVTTPITLSLVWFSFMTCIFLKCGLVPFFFWKPTFFKGITLHALFLYVCFYYYFLLSFFTYFLLVYLNELFYFSIFVNYVLILGGTVLLSFVLCESYYIKAFLAMSSILNTLLVFLAMSSITVTDVFFAL